LSAAKSKYADRKVKETDMWICPECETKNIDEAKLCLACGVGRICPACNEVMSGDVCEHCREPFKKINWMNKAEFEIYKEEKAAADRLLDSACFYRGCRRTDQLLYCL